MAKADDNCNCKQRPEWVPNGAGNAFTTEVMKGVEGGHDGMPGQSANTQVRTKPKKRKQLSVEDYVNGVLAGDRVILSRAITLVESNNPSHSKLAKEVIQKLQVHSGNCVRIGITGVPGAGKSSLIEALGVKLCKEGHKIAVLAVDPSSSRTGGSILGDKTRMETLTREDNAFIRPSPSSGALGGVARKSRETMLLCEAAGFDIILVETVGVGQSEVTVRSMVDIFLLVLISGAGDDLQGIKKGVMEIADTILVNKADGDNKLKAQGAKTELNQVLHYLQPATEGWQTPAQTVSAMTGEGLEELWETVQRYITHTKEQDLFKKRRQDQNVEWVHSLIEEGLRNLFYQDPEIAQRLPEIENGVIQERIPAAAAVEELLQQFSESQAK